MAVGDAYLFPGFLTPVLTLSFQSHRLLFPHASAEVRGENTPERKVASTGDRTRNHQVMSPTRSPLSHLGGTLQIAMENIVTRGEIACNKQFLLFSQCFLPYMTLIVHFKCTLKCCLQSVSVWISLKFCRLVMG